MLDILASLPQLVALRPVLEQTVLPLIHHVRQSVRKRAMAVLVAMVESGDLAFTQPWIQSLSKAKSMPTQADKENLQTLVLMLQ